MRDAQTLVIILLTHITPSLPSLLPHQQAMQSNPQLMQQAQQAMAGGGGMPGMPPPPSSSALGGVAPASGGLDFSALLGGAGAGMGGGQAAPGQGHQRQRSDAEMTEEELIQQAIERSLREM